MIQPKEVREEIKLPDPNTKPEPEPEYAEGDGDGDGVVGGVVGGAQAAAPAKGGGFEEAPVYATTGFTPPREKQRGCVAQAVRIPRDLQGIVSTVVTKFGVKPSGQPYAFSIVGPQPDQRIINAVWQAIQQCDWQPGADAQGRPTSIWVTLPLRFTSG
jgi:protein TonB